MLYGDDSISKRRSGSAHNKFLRTFRYRIEYWYRSIILDRGSMTWSKHRGGGVSELDFQSTGTTSSRNERINNVCNGWGGGGGANVQQQLLSNTEGMPSVPGPLLGCRVRRPSDMSARDTETEETTRNVRSGDYTKRGNRRITWVNRLAYHPSRKTRPGRPAQDGQHPQNFRIS